MLHLDKALTRIREYERMRLKADFNPRSAASADVGDASNATRPSSNYADKTEGSRRPRGSGSTRPRLKLDVCLLCVSRSVC